MSSRSELKENILANKVEAALRWTLERKVQALAALGVLIVAILIGSVFYLRNQQLKNDAWTRFSQAQELMARGSFDISEAILTEVKTSAPGSLEAAYADYYLGEVFLRQEKFNEAAEHFSSAAALSEGNPLQPLALSNLGFARERQGNFDDAVSAYQQFMDKHADHFLAARVQLLLGRSYAEAGNIPSASDALGQLIDLYPTSSWAEKARRILDKLKTR